MFKKHGVGLLLVLVLALLLRGYKVTKIPSALNWDEVSIGYNAYSILTTGKDEWGVKLPLHFQSYGEYKLPAQIYASIPAIAVFGLNPFGVRITPVIYGTLTVLLLFLLVQGLFGRGNLSLVSSFLLAISPWHIQLTRASFESSFSLFWVLLGMWWLVKGMNGKKYWWIISAIPFAISFYTYNSARVFTPLFLLVLGLVFLKVFRKNFKTSFLAGLLFASLLMPAVPFVLSGEASARYKLVSIVNEAGLVPRINENRGLSKLPAPLPRFIHNRVTYISFYVAQSYLAHFTPIFLFFKGAGHVQHHVQSMGELYKFQAPLLIFGLYLIFRKKESYRWFLMIWLLLAFVPVATTRDSIPNALRTVIANPVYQIVTAYGLLEVLVFLKKRNFTIYYLLFTIVLLIGLLEITGYLRNLFEVYPVRYSRDWQYGNREAVEYIKEHYDDYDLIVYTRAYGEPHMFTLFYLTYPPQNYFDNPNLVRFKSYDWVWVTNFDKFYFPNLSDEGTEYWDIVNQNPDKSILFIGKESDFEASKPRLKTINFLDGSRAFDIVAK
jgi:4-amino-4-deoxy-L-arabinose transferase-like glycosyltransferase